MSWKKHIVMCCVGVFCAAMYYLILFYADDKCFLTAPRVGKKVVVALSMGLIGVYIPPVTKFIFPDKKKDN